ncbi:MAG: SDR family NAD(P)-dependent oxidoreductase [Methylococcales bacterium]|nr:SDR family NAD(P)-dependent oxidoreductase [Methylococcales bacterium]
MNNQQVLITGGTGSFGRAFVRYIFENYPQVIKVVVFSRDEQKQFEMAQEFSPTDYPIKYILGDVRNIDSLLKATKNIDILIHAAAMKHVPAAEQNPMECVMTNILGSQNVIDAAFANKVKKVVALSTDKSTYPINVYGASKLFLEKLFIYADSQKETQDIRFSVVRYGNIFGSKGSVVPFFLKKRNDDFLPITHPEMTRFSITMQEGIDLVMYALEYGWGGEVIVPIAPSYRILDVATAIAPDIEHRIIGMRAGEKIEEILITRNEAAYAVRRDDYYIICPVEGGAGIAINTARKLKQNQ